MALTFVQRIKELLTGKRDIKSGVRLVINCEKLENRVALLDKGIVEEYNIERVGTNSLIGSVFKGRIRNIEQGLKAMFIDIGFDKITVACKRGFLQGLKASCFLFVVILASAVNASEIETGI